MFNAVINACGREEAIRESACLAVRQASASGVSWAPNCNLNYLFNNL